MKRLGGTLLVPVAAALLALALYTAFVGRPPARAQEESSGTWAAVRLVSYPEQDVHYVMLVSPKGDVQVVRWERQPEAYTGQQTALRLVSTMSQQPAP